MLQEEFPDLSKIYGANSLMPGMFAMERFEGAQRSQQLNQAKALQDFYQAERTNPLEVEKLRIGNETSLAQLPGWQADSSMKQDKAKISRDTLGLQLSAQQKKLLADASDDDVKLLENAAQQLAYSSNPQESARGQQLLTLHKEVVKEKEKQRYMTGRQMEVENNAQRGRKELEQMRINAGKYQKNAQLSFDAQLRSGKLSYEKAAVLANSYADFADMEGDSEKASFYRNMANTYAKKNVEAKQAGAMVPRAGTPDLQGMSIPTQPTVPVAPLTSAVPSASAPPAQAAPQKMSLPQLQQLYPGVPADKLKEAYKKKFGIDIN